MRFTFNNTSEKQAISSFIGHCKLIGVKVGRLAIRPVQGRKGSFTVNTVK